MSRRPIRSSVTTGFFLIRLKSPLRSLPSLSATARSRPGYSPRAASRLADHAGRSSASRGQLVVRGYARGQAAQDRAGRAPGTRPDHIPAGRAAQILAESSRAGPSCQAPAATEAGSATSSGPRGLSGLSVSVSLSVTARTGARTARIPRHRPYSQKPSEKCATGQPRITWQVVSDTVPTAVRRVRM
jgi:hypothetical protein